MSTHRYCAMLYCIFRSMMLVRMTTTLLTSAKKARSDKHLLNQNAASSTAMCLKLVIPRLIPLNTTTTVCTTPVVATLVEIANVSALLLLPMPR